MLIIPWLLTKSQNFPLTISQAFYHFYEMLNAICHNTPKIRPLRADKGVFFMNMAYCVMSKFGSKKAAGQQNMYFRLKSLFCIYFKNNKKIYASLTNLQKVFDFVVHPSLLH